MTLGTFSPEDNHIFLLTVRGRRHPPQGSSQLVIPSMIRAHGIQQGKPCLRLNLQREIIHENPVYIHIWKKQYWQSKRVPFI